MSWQEIVFTVGSWVFLLALLPSLLGRDKPALLTSIATGSVLIAFAVAYLSLSLTSSGISIGLLGCLWLVLALQKYIQRRRKTEDSA